MHRLSPFSIASTPDLSFFTCALLIAPLSPMLVSSVVVQSSYERIASDDVYTYDSVPPVIFSSNFSD